MKRKHLGLVLGLVLVALLWAIPASWASSLDDVKAKGVLIFATDATCPPFEAVDEDGALLLRQADGTVRRITGGAVMIV